MQRAGKMFTSYFIESFQGRIKKDKNPILNKESLARGEPIEYYKIEPNSIKRHPKKLYKNMDQKEPPMALLEPFADEQLFEKNYSAGATAGKQAPKDILFKDQAQDISNQKKSFQAPESQTSSKINIPGIDDSSTKAKQPSKPLIQVNILEEK